MEDDLECGDVDCDTLVDDEIDIQEPKMYEVWVMNDHYTSFDLVIYVLVTIFHKSENDAKIITVQVHQNGKGLAGIYTEDIARTKCIESMAIARSQGMPLKVILKESN